VLLALFAAVLAPTAVAPTVAVLAVTLFLVGLPIAPLNALAGLALQRIVALPRQAEGFALYPAMILIGAGSGQALAGIALRAVTPAQLILGLATVPAVLAGAVVAAMVRRRLRGVPQGVGYPYDPAVLPPHAVVDVH
jgi:hypothetical protein